MKEFLNKLFKKSYFPWVFQVLFIVVALLLMWGGWGVDTPDRKVLMQLRNTNFANLLVWSYWWPILIVVTVLWGRLWCTVCPVELLSRLCARIGLKLNPPKFIRSRWMIVILYAFISIVAVRYWDIHRVPHYMALYLMIAFSAAILVGLLFKERSFCKYFCPIGLLLAFYSLMSRWGIHVKGKPACLGCKEKNCMNQHAKRSFLASPCLSNVNVIDEKHDKRHCQLCTHCIKLCPNDNISYTRSKRSYSLMNIASLTSAELAMAILVTAYSFHEAVGKLPWGDFMHSFSAFCSTVIPDAIIPAKIMDGIALFIILPTFCFVVCAAINTLIGKQNFKESFTYAVAFMLPLGVIGELNKGIFKMLSRFPYIKYSLADFDGTAYAEAIANKTIVINKVPYYNEILFAVGILVFTWAMVVIIKKIRSEEKLLPQSKVLFIAFAMLYYVVAGLYPAIMKIL